jgi:redox-sensitive bicupin YhaK (pirin superfamily)
MARSRLKEIALSAEPLKGLRPLSSPWQCVDPFLMCNFQNDVYPKGNENLGPAEPLTDRNLGEDFSGKGGWSMYHGERVPGFPRHPHRGFETITVLRQGFIDHADSLGSSGRYGPGDVQWITAGQGISHSETTPLLNSQIKNPVELFQIWLNLPKDKKLVEPVIQMIWEDQVPRIQSQDSRGRETELTLIAGKFNDSGKQYKAVSPPPNSWGADPENELAIWVIRLAPHARFSLPMANALLNRTLYFFRGRFLKIGSLEIESQQIIELRPDCEVELVNGSEESEVLFLQARPIAEPVVSRGPFVMNSEEEIQQAFVDYRRTHFGGWPWKKDDVIFKRNESRFFRSADGRVERRPLSLESKKRGAHS